MNHTSNNKGKKFPPEPLSTDEVLRLMNQCSRRAPTGVRDRALIAMMWRGQLRVSEALALKPSDVDMKELTVRVLHGKGDKWRLVVIDQQTVDVLQTWLAVRASLGWNGRQPLFCTLRGGPMNPACVREMLPQRAAKAGIEKRCNPHNLRHSGASGLVDEGVPLLEIQEQLGHASPATVSRYLHQLNPKARIDRLRSRRWDDTKEAAS